MKLDTQLSDSTQIVTVVANRIDSAVAIQFKDALRTATSGGPERVVLDLHSVNFVDSSGLGAIVAAMKYLGAERKLDLAGLNPDVDKVFRLTPMDTIFDIFGDVEAALENAAV